jgi:spore coat protein U-like protein
MKSTAVGTDTLGYTLSITTYNGYAGTGFGAAVSIPFTGTVTQAQFQNAVPHADYAETVTITITY